MLVLVDFSCPNLILRNIPPGLILLTARQQAAFSIEHVFAVTIRFSLLAVRLLSTYARIAPLLVLC